MLSFLAYNSVALSTFMVLCNSHHYLRAFSSFQRETILIKLLTPWDFPGGPAVKTPRSQCGGPEFDPWLGNYITHACCN